MIHLDWGQLVAQGSLLGMAVGAIGWLVRQSTTHRFKALEDRVVAVEDQNEAGEKLHREQGERIRGVEESAKAAHHRLDRID
jgi:hypothetical protein